ncbi:MAG: ORF6N domain-containing protein [Bacteroidales bacterium]|nr:ORF6N domain-containing protein [Bacteroidales bacterium]
MEKNSLSVYDEDGLRSKIHTIRGIQVMLDFDLAKIYGYETKNFNRQVKNNIERFDEDFRFQLTNDEVAELSRCKNFTLNTGRGSNIKYNPYAFTEQGIYMLMTVLKGDLAIQQSKKLIRLFKQMKDYIIQNHNILGYNEILRLAQQTEKNSNDIEELKNKMLTKDNIDEIIRDFSEPILKDYIFYNGQQFDAYTFISDLVRKAKKEIILIDNYIDDSVLKILNKRANNVTATIYTAHFSDNLKLDLQKHNTQYQPIDIKVFKDSHDRFLIIDDDVYHIGASLKDLGKKMFAFSKMEISKDIILSIL